VERIWSIKQAQALGLALDEVADLLALSPDEVACADLATRFARRPPSSTTSSMPLPSCPPPSTGCCANAVATRPGAAHWAV